MTTLNAWVNYLNQLPRILKDPAVFRCKKALTKLNFSGFHQPVIAITGTNGKGSSAALLNAIWQAQGYRCALFTSPHLFRFNERFKVNNQEIEDDLLVEAFEYLYNYFAKDSLSYFDYCFLIAIYIFQKLDCDVIILEAGIGGRLDAINALDADLVLITQIGHDHSELLGHDRESVAYEKAGLMRKGKPLVFAEPMLPQAIRSLSQTLKAPVYYAEEDFNAALSPKDWSWSTAGYQHSSLPYPRIHLSNASACLMVLHVMNTFLSVTHQAIIDGLESVYLPARREQREITFSGHKVEHIFDVAHNLEAVGNLNNYLKTLSYKKTIAVFSMLNDKDIPSVIGVIQNQIDQWHIAPLEAPRAASTAALLNSLLQQGIPANKIHLFQSVEEAYLHACKAADKTVRICTFGSFYTVRNVLGFASSML